MNKLECKSNNQSILSVFVTIIWQIINAALTSVLDQIDDNYEVLVVDDGSTDNSVEIQKFCKKI